MPKTEEQSIIPPENREAYAALGSALRKKQLILFAGAGVSSGAGYPSWDELLDLLHKAALKNTRKKQSDGGDQKVAGGTILLRLRRLEDDLWRAQKYREMLGEDRFNEFILETFSGKDNGQPGVADLLASLPFRHVLTTNYDPTLLKAFQNRYRSRINEVRWTKREEVRRFFESLAAKGPERYFVYLHGTHNRPQDIVLTDQQYVDRYFLSQEANSKLSALFMTHRLLFVGVSLEDPQFNNLFRTVHAYLGQSAPSNASNNFMLLQAYPDLRKNRAYVAFFREKYGIELVFYDRSPEHRGLATVLQLLRDRGGDLRAYDKLIKKAQPPAKPQRAGKRKIRPAFDPDDPNKGRFGGEPSRGPFTLSAVVTRDEDEPEWFDVTLTVTTTRDRFPGAVTFYLHPTFSRSKVTLKPKGKTVQLDRWAYGAFTVGVEIEKTKYKLELDLSELPDAPALFRSR